MQEYEFLDIEEQMRRESFPTRKFYYRYSVLAFSDRKNITFVERDVFLKGSFYHLPELECFCDDKTGAKFFCPSYEPSNPYDKNAIIVKNDFGGTLGYVPREVALRVSLLNPKVKNSLYIRPHFKAYYTHEYRGDHALFKFDIVQIKDFSKLTDVEKGLYVKIKKETVRFSRIPIYNQRLRGSRRKASKTVITYSVNPQSKNGLPESLSDTSKTVSEKKGELIVFCIFIGVSVWTILFLLVSFLPT